MFFSVRRDENVVWRLVSRLPAAERERFERPGATGKKGRGGTRE
jgi:hypothetical protein